MNVEGFAFKANETELREQYHKRYKEIEHHVKTINMKRIPAYGRGNFSGVLNAPEEKALSEMDLCLIADRGNLCFGGTCTKSGDNFSGSYFTD
jgi:hypothetical protein